MLLDGMQARGVRSQHALHEVKAFDELFEYFLRGLASAICSPEVPSETGPRFSRPGDAPHDRVGATKAEDCGRTERYLKFCSGRLSLRNSGAKT